MAKPLNLFIHQPVSAWTVVHPFGFEEPVPANLRDAVLHNTVLLRTAGEGELLAAAGGSLTARPPRTVGLDPSEGFIPIAAGAPLPETVNLFVHPSPLEVREPAFRLRALEIGSISGFAYIGVETASLEAALGPLLDKTILALRRTPLTRAQLVEQFVRGMLNVRVTKGHAIGNASTEGAPSGSRQFAFASLSPGGPLDPSFTYEWMVDFVDDGQAAVNQLTGLIPVRWPLIDPGLSVAEAIATTEDVTYPFSTLTDFKRSRGLSEGQWREVGNNQKALYLERLRVRYGHTPAGSTEPPFEFDDVDRNNLFQLEAVVEFFANFDDPWANGAVPVDPSTAPLEGTAATAAGDMVTLAGAPPLTGVIPNRHFLDLAEETPQGRPTHRYRITEVLTGPVRVRTDLDSHPPPAGTSWRIHRYKRVEFTDLFGSAATLDGGNASLVTLDGDPDLRRLRPSRKLPNGKPADWDTIEFGDHTGGAQRYRICATDPENHTVTVDGTPSFTGASSGWRIRLRPVLVVIDPFGARSILLGGTDATVPSASQSQQVHLASPAPTLNRINRSLSASGHALGFDTIYLPADTARATRTYRIIDVDDATDIVTLDGSPTLAGGQSHWHIQSGISGDLPAMVYNLTGNAMRGWDHYDGCLFVVYGGEVGGDFRWSSYTSHNYQPPNESLSSIRGNREYDFYSFRSGTAFRHYSMKVTDGLARDDYDGVRENRFYFANPVTEDSAGPGQLPVDGGLGKTTIRLHYGAIYGDSCESAGCVVSPNYMGLIDELTDTYQGEYNAIHGMSDAQVRRLQGRSHAGAKNLYRGRVAGGLYGNGWNDKITGTLWVIRPDEPPLP